MITWQPFKFPPSDTQKKRRRVGVCERERVPEGGVSMKGRALAQRGGRERADTDHCSTDHNTLYSQAFFAGKDPQHKMPKSAFLPRKCATNLRHLLRKEICTTLQHTVRHTATLCTPSRQINHEFWASFAQRDPQHTATTHGNTLQHKCNTLHSCTANVTLWGGYD